jgi:hypothetical protein
LPVLSCNHHLFIIERRDGCVGFDPYTRATIQRLVRRVNNSRRAADFNTVRVCVPLVRFNSDCRVIRAVLGVGPDDVLIYVYTFFHRSVPFVKNDAASLRTVTAMVKRFYLLSLFSQPARRTAQRPALVGHGRFAAVIANVLA